MKMIDQDIEHDKIAILAEAFANLVRLEEHGGNKESLDAPIALGLHYVNIANSITARIVGSRNTEYHLTSNGGIKITLIIGKPNKVYSVKIKKNELIWKKWP